MQDEILRLINECTNSVGSNAAAVMKEGQIVGHVPFNLALVILTVLEKRLNKALLELLEGK